MYFPKRDAFGLKSVRALPKDSRTNSAEGIWVVSFEPFLPGALTLSSMSDLIANLLFSDFPLPVSPLGNKDVVHNSIESLTTNDTHLSTIA